MVTQEKSLHSDQETLKSAGFRLTSQRALILDIISQGRGHLDADEVYRLAREQQPNISLSTVYRNLQALKKLGLVEELHFDESHHHYEMKGLHESKIIIRFWIVGLLLLIVSLSTLKLQ